MLSRSRSALVRTVGSGLGARFLSPLLLLPAPRLAAVVAVLLLAPVADAVVAAVARLVSPDGRLALAGMEVEAEEGVGAGNAPVVAKELSRARVASCSAPERSAPDEELECDR